MFTLSEAMQALDGREEFAVKKKDGLTVINYLITLPDSFVGIRENFRGVVFDDATGQIVSLPLHKFYNVNQKEHTQLHLIGETECRVLDKFDGTMCHALRVNGNIVLASRMGWDSSQAVAATKLMLKKPGLVDIIEYEIDEGRTPIFEYVGPNNPIVLHYKNEDLVYLWSRDRVTGDYSRNPHVLQKHSFSPERRMLLKDVMAEVATLQDKEGFVCVLPGMWVKAKCPWYMDRHQAFDMLMKPLYRLYEVGLQGKLDDLIAQCADMYKPKLEQILTTVGLDQIRLHRELRLEYDGLCEQLPSIDTDHERRKAFVMLAKPSPHFGGLMMLYSGRSIDAWVNARLFDQYKLTHTGRLFTDLSDDS